MKVIALKFENYRNLKDNIITPCDGVNIIYGDNAQGKTNLLEALWFFCGGHSFRGSKDSEIINWDENFARIEMRFLGQEREQTAKILFRGGKKSVEINGVQKNSAAALIERFCAVVFSPEHLSLIKRGPGERRKFIDSAICREKLKNAVVLSKYNRILNQRNSLLKDIYRRPSLADTLPVWDEPLLKSGAVLVKNRIDYVKPEDIPNIDLYMDQVTTFMDSQLATSKRHEDDKILTKTMINNYAKNDLLPPPEKKKYSKEHVLTLIFIYYFKSILSISDIQSILNPITDKYFGKGSSEMSLEDIYKEVFGLEHQETLNIMKDLAKKFNTSMKTFEGMEGEDAELLRTFSFICMLSYDVYLKKTIIERIVDQMLHEEKDPSKKEK